MKGSFSILVLLVLAACSTQITAPPPTAERREPMPSTNAASDASGATFSRTLSELERQEGTLVRVQGAYRFPTEKAFARNKLVLNDGTEVILVPPYPERQAELLVAANQGRTMVVRGRVYVKDIPARYRIIARTPDPYLLEIDDLALAPAPLR